MGNLCSKSGTHSGGHVVLGSSSVTTNSAPPVDARAAAAEAAEQRMKAAQARGTNASNPNQGKLAAKVAANPKRVPQARQEETLVWD